MTRSMIERAWVSNDSISLIIETMDCSNWMIERYVWWLSDEFTQITSFLFCTSHCSKSHSIELNCEDLILSDWKKSSFDDYTSHSLFHTWFNWYWFNSILINMNWCWSVWIRQQIRMTWFPWYYSVFLESLRVLDSDLHFI